jgi:prepilin-type N-terminal cleavage/methylation domain-containing protein
MKNQKRQAGFTLIELMIVIAIIGILMAYAIPAYRDYTVKTKRGECNALLDGLKTPIAEYFYDFGTWPTNAAALDKNFVATPNISSLVWNATSTTFRIDCTMTAPAGSNAVQWTANYASGDMAVRWTCNDTGGAATDVCPRVPAP